MPTYWMKYNIIGRGIEQAFAEEMESSGTAAEIRKEKGNLRYEFFIPMADPETVLLIDCWEV